MMEGSLPIFFKDQELLLLKERAIYWKDQSTLILSDLHLGKVGHFRKEGLAVPAEAADKEYETLTSILEQCEVKTLLIAGDFTHSVYNEELERFVEWRTGYPELKVLLIKGNHDILPEAFYLKAGVHVIDDRLELSPFVFSHHPLEKTKLYNVAGHIHPGVELVGKARQRLTLSCFYFGKKLALLPAFGSFTGNCKISARKGDRVFVITSECVVEAGKT